MATPIDIIMATPQEPTNQEEASSTPRVGSAPTPTVSDAANATPATSATPPSGADATATPTSSTPNQPVVVDTSKLKSDVWEHMTKKVIGGKIRAVCKYCNNDLAAAPNSGTRHLFSVYGKGNPFKTYCDDSDGDGDIDGDGGGGGEVSTLEQLQE